MTDIIERLRIKLGIGHPVPDDWDDEETRMDAADEIENLREALRLERKLRDAALKLAHSLQEELDRINERQCSACSEPEVK